MSVFSFLIAFLSLSVPATALWPLHAQQPLAFEKTSSTGINENPDDSNSNHATATILASASCSSLTPSYPTSFWYEEIEHNGLSSFLDESYGTYTVFRNVVADFGADNTGKSDASEAIQNAILGKAERKAAHG
jgi:polygalacturonase